MQLHMRSFFAFTILLSALIANQAFAQTPHISVAGLPAEMLIGEEYCSEVSFTNTHATPGYGPYFFTTVPPLVDVTNVKFVDIPPTVEITGTIDASGQIADPISGTMATGEPGGTGRLVRYPVGSLVQGQDALNIQFCMSFRVGAEIDLPLAIEVLPGFEYGDTPTGDNGPVVGSPINSTLTPIVARINKENTAPENERPPGPSNTFNYIYTMDISDTALVNDIVLTDQLPPRFSGLECPSTSPHPVASIVSL